MGLECYPRSQVSLLVTYYFIGFGFGVIFYPIPDLYGRKTALVFAMTGYLAAFALLLLNPSFQSRSISLFLIGFFHLRSTSSFVLCMDIAPDDSKFITTTTMNIIDGGTLIYMGIYFMFIKDYFPY